MGYAQLHGYISQFDTDAAGAVVRRMIHRVAGEVIDIIAVLHTARRRRT